MHEEVDFLVTNQLKLGALYLFSRPTSYNKAIPWRQKNSFELANRSAIAKKTKIFSGTFSWQSKYQHYKSTCHGVMPVTWCTSSQLEMCIALPKSARYPSLMPINILQFTVFRFAGSSLHSLCLTAVGSICHGPRMKPHLQTPRPHWSCLGGVFPGWADYIGAWVFSMDSSMNKHFEEDVCGLHLRLYQNSCHCGSSACLSHKPNDSYYTFDTLTVKFFQWLGWVCRSAEHSLS